MATKITVAGKEIEVKELTVREIRDWFKSLESAANKKDTDLDSIDWALFKDATLSDVLRMTEGLKKTDLDEMTPREIDEVLVKAREINPHFFEMRERMSSMGEAIIGLDDKAQKL